MPDGEKERHGVGLLIAATAFASILAAGLMGYQVGRDRLQVDQLTEGQQVAVIAVNHGRPDVVYRCTPGREVP